jgi:hypothetical protein
VKLAAITSDLPSVISGKVMPKLSEFVEMAATEYMQDTGSMELDARWLAEFFQDSGVPDEYPRQDMLVFFALVQKALTLKFERAKKISRMQLEK